MLVEFEFNKAYFPYLHRKPYIIIIDLIKVCFTLNIVSMATYLEFYPEGIPTNRTRRFHESALLKVVPRMYFSDEQNANDFVLNLEVYISFNFILEKNILC